MRFFLFFLFTFFSYAQITNNSLRISYQNIHFNLEHLGLLETSYFFHYKYFYTGISVYSAIYGKRGGFFVGGITGGLQYPLFKKYYLDSGVFIGGGGGGHAPQGSGFMSKFYTGVLFKDNKFSYGININNIQFKDSPINSTQIGLILDYNFQDIFFFKKPIKNYGYYGIEKITFSPFIINYFPINSKNTSNEKQKNFSILGAEISKKYKNYSFLISAGGAFAGNSDGYAEYLIGISKKIHPLIFKFLIGAAGGGKVKTNGGFIYKIQAQTNFKFINPSLGFMQAPNGIKAFYGGIYFHKSFNLITLGKKKLYFKPQKFNFKIYSESYLSPQRKNNDNKRLDVLNLEFGIYKNKNIILFLNTAAAYNGKSGGYAVGMFGAEYKFKNIFTKISIGAAGGGNLDVGGGLIAKSEVGFNYKNLFFSIGRIKAINGKLNSTIFSLGINFDFYKGIVK